MRGWRTMGKRAALILASGLAGLLVVACGSSRGASPSPAGEPESIQPAVQKVEPGAINSPTPAGEPGDLQEALKLSQEHTLDIQSLQAKSKELEGRVSSLGDEIANLPSDKLDEANRQIALLSARLRSLEAKLNNAVVIPTPVPGDSGLGATRKPPVTDVEAQIFKKACDFYYDKEYAQAVRQFQDLLDRYPVGLFADNCHYWIGECRFAQGDFPKAMASFRKVFDFPESEKADDAQVKLAYCYLKQGDRKQAAVEFKKVVSLYPDSQYTERAKEELARLE